VNLPIVKIEAAPDVREPPQPLFVLKFGSSLLRTTADLARVAGEIYRQRRAGRAMVAVVSAFAGETDELFQQAARVTGLASCRGVPDLISLGEEKTAALLRLACDRIGLRAEICRPEELGLCTEGDGLSAEPVRLEPMALLAKLEFAGVVIVPGYVGISKSGERTLLGRGGSDFSAVFIGGELGADCVRLYKDVDGVFERDPASFEGAARYGEISWADALRIARPLIQPQAVEYAANKKLFLEIETLGSTSATCVGDRTGIPKPARVAQPLRVSIAGYGVVGQALVERLREEPGFEIQEILVRDLSRARAVTPPVPLTDNTDAFLSTASDVIVDALSCEATGSLLCNDVLPRGVNIVSASKRLISAEHGPLTDAALVGGSKLLYSAAVGGSATVLETVDRARTEGNIREVVGVLNGTVNFILQRISQGLDFDSALREAQELGFAEENPEADLSGADAAAKLRLIAFRAMDIAPQSVVVATERLDPSLAMAIGKSGERWVQVARATRRADGIRASVALQPLREVAQLPAILDEWNCAAVTLEDGRIYRCLGRGAGGAATAEAIVADLYEVLRSRGASNQRTAELQC
jgi:homoserine dehydrogenase